MASLTRERNVHSPPISYPQGLFSHIWWCLLLQHLQPRATLCCGPGAHLLIKVKWTLHAQMQQFKKGQFRLYKILCLMHCPLARCHLQLSVPIRCRGEKSRAQCHCYWLWGWEEEENDSWTWGAGWIWTKRKPWLESEELNYLIKKPSMFLPQGESPVQCWWQSLCSPSVTLLGQVRGALSENDTLTFSQKQTLITKHIYSHH